MRVADRDLVGGLLLVSDCTSCSIVRPDSDSRCSIQVSGSASAALCPCSRRASSATNELTIGGFERAMSAITRIRLFGIVLGDVHHLVGPRIGPVPVDRAGRDPGADAAQVLDQRQPQHDRNRPQLAQLERRHRLVGRHEAGKALRVDPAVAVRDRLERDVVDARQPGGGPVRQARQLAAVPLGQVPLGRADLLFDQVEVVEQPFRGGRDAAVRRDRRRQQVADFDQDAFVLGQPRQQPVGRAPGASRCAAARFLPCCSIWSALNSSDRSGGSSSAYFPSESARPKRAVISSNRSKIVRSPAFNSGILFFADGSDRTRAWHGIAAAGAAPVVERTTATTGRTSSSDGVRSACVTSSACRS